MGIRATRLGPCIVSHGGLGSASRTILRPTVSRLLGLRFRRKRYDRGGIHSSVFLGSLAPGTPYCAGCRA